MTPPAILLALLAASAAPPVVPLPPGEEAKRDALTRYGLGVQTAHNDRPGLAAKQFQAAAERDPKAAAPHRELAKVYADLGRDASAIREARAALALDPDDFATAVLLGKLLMEGHKYADAVAAYRLAVDSKSIVGVPLQQFAALCDLARAATRANDPAAAEAAYSSAIALAVTRRADLTKPGGFEPRGLDRNRVELHEAYGEALIARKKYDGAAAAFEAARDLSLDKQGANLTSGVARIHLNLAKVYEAQGDTNAALRELERHIAFLPAGATAYERYAGLLRKSGRANDVLPALQQLAAKDRRNKGLNWLIAAEQLRRGEALFRVPLTDPGDADGFRILVRAYLEAKKYGELLAHADSLAKEARGSDAEEDSPRPKKAANAEAVGQVRLLHAAVKAERGHTQALVGQLATDFTAGTARAPETLDLLNYMAFRDGCQAELAAALQTALRENTRTPEIYTLLFEVLRDRRKWNDLKDVAEDAKKSPAFKGKLGPYYSAALAHAELGKEAESMAEIEFVVGNVVADGRLGAMLEKARLLNLLGQHRESLKVCGEVRAEFPAAAAHRRVAILEADAHHRMKDAPKAEGLLRDLLADDPDDVLVLNNLGYNLADQSRKLAEAETMIRRAVELDRDARLRVHGTPEAESGTYLDSLGWVLFRRGELEKARDVLLKATTLPDSAPDAVVWDHLGDVQYRLNAKAEARRAWGRAVELYRDSHQGREAGRLDDAKRKIDLP